MDDTESFEKAHARLAEVVAELEGGGLTLEQSLAVFEEGLDCCGICRKRLVDAQRRIESLKGKLGESLGETGRKGA